MNTTDPLTTALRRGKLLLLWAEMPFPPLARPPHNAAQVIDRWQERAAGLPPLAWPLAGLPPLPILSLDPSERLAALLSQAGRTPQRVCTLGDAPRRGGCCLLQLGGELAARRGLLLSWDDVRGAPNDPDKAHLLREAAAVVGDGALLVLAPSPGEALVRLWRELLWPHLRGAAHAFVLGPAAFPWPAPLVRLEGGVEEVVAALGAAVELRAEERREPMDNDAALTMARRALAILERQAAGYTTLTIPVALQIELEEKRRQVAELETRSGIGQSAQEQPGRGGGGAPRPVEEIRHRYALLIGVRDYVDPSYRSLPHTVVDVVELASVLQAAGFTVRLLHSEQPEEGLQPTRENIWGELESLAQATGPGDLLLVHFAGHGDLDLAGRAYLLPKNGRKSSLGRTAVGLDEFKATLAGAGAQARILILDACHSGIGRGGPGMDETFERLVHREATGTATLAACRHGEVAYEHDQSAHGAFTYYILEGLRGAAIQSGGRLVSFNRLAEYVTFAVKNWALGKGLQQWPNVSAQLVGDPALIEGARCG